MAKVKFGSAVAEVRGSIGGLTYARNAGGAYIRSRISPIQRNTTRQNQAKSIFSAAVNTWTNTLTSFERDGWNTYASAVPYTDVFGMSRNYSGQQSYVRCYIASVNAGVEVSAIAAAPTIYTEAEGIEAANLTAAQGAVAADSTVSFVNTLSPADATAGDMLLLYIGGPVTAATNYFKGPYRYAGQAVFVSGEAYPDAVLTDPWGRECAAGLLLPVQWRIVKADNRMSPVSQGLVTLGVFAA
jgi:hypothetical protein